MSEANARFLGTIPELYDRHLGPVIFEPYAADLAHRVAAVTTGTVLEIACGTGILTQQLRARLSPEVRLVATDLKVPFGFHDADVLRRFLRASDFGQVKLERVSFEARSPSAKSFAVGLVKGNPVSITIQERGGTLDPIVDALEASLARVGGDRPFRSTMRALVVTARAGADCPPMMP